MCQGVLCALAKCFLLRLRIVCSTSFFVDKIMGVGEVTLVRVSVLMYIFCPVSGSMCSSSFHV